MNQQIITHPSPHRGQISFWALMFGCCAAPIFWLGQEMLGYGFSAVACYHSYEPTPGGATAGLRDLLIAFDAVAIVAALAGGAVSYFCWQRVRDEKRGGGYEAVEIGDGRARFMAIWGMIASLWFLGAIVFTTIANTGTPLCA